MASRFSWPKHKIRDVPIRASSSLKEPRTAIVIESSLEPPEQTWVLRTFTRPTGRESEPGWALRRPLLSRIIPLAGVSRLCTICVQNVWVIAESQCLSDHCSGTPIRVIPSASVGQNLRNALRAAEGRFVRGRRLLSLQASEFPVKPIVHQAKATNS